MRRHSEQGARRRITSLEGIIEPRYSSRADAGRQLAAQLLAYANRPDALPRGGVSPAFEVTQALHAPPDGFGVRKLGMPGLSELALGALASGGLLVANSAIANPLGLRDRLITGIAARAAHARTARASLSRRSPAAAAP